MDNYKSASVIFWKYDDHKNILIFLGYENKIEQWRHFGGKREEKDKNSFNTMLREVEEESGIKMKICGNIPFNYFSESKQIVYLHRCRKLTKTLNDLKPTDVKTKYNWFKFEDLKALKGLPVYILNQLKYFHQNGYF